MFQPIISARFIFCILQNVRTPVHVLPTTYVVYAIVVSGRNENESLWTENKHARTYEDLYTRGRAIGKRRKQEEKWQKKKEKSPVRLITCHVTLAVVRNDWDWGEPRYPVVSGLYKTTVAVTAVDGNVGHDLTRDVPQNECPPFVLLTFHRYKRRIHQEHACARAPQHMMPARPLIASLILGHRARLRSSYLESISFDIARGENETKKMSSILTLVPSLELRLTDRKMHSVISVTLYENCMRMRNEVSS